MKKIVALIMAMALLFSLFAACSKSNDKTENTTTPEQPQAKTDAPPATSGENSNQSGDITKTDDVDIEQEDVKVHPSDDATFRFAVSTAFGYLTQTGHAYTSTGTVSLCFGESLFRWNSSENAVDPYIATSYEWLDDLTLRVHIRDDVNSILGDPFTANDVLFSWEWGASNSAQAQYFNFFDMDNTKVVDDYTIDFALKDPYPFLVLDLCHSAYHVACEKSIETIGGKEAALMNPNGLTGPYKMTKLDEVSQVCYAERRDDYWGIMPYYKYIEVYSVTDANSRAMGIEAGDYDLIMYPTASSCTTADGKVSKAWYVAGAGRFADLKLNSDHEPLNIKEVRQAIALAINYEAILAVVGAGNGVLSDSSFASPINQFSYTEAKDPDNCYLGHTDVEKAKELLASAGYADGFSITCTYKNSDNVCAGCAEIVKNHLAQIGIDMVLAPVDAATFNSITGGSDWDCSIALNGNPNPKRCLLPLDPGLDNTKATAWCGSSWCDDVEAVHDIVNRCITTVDDAERLKAFEEMNDICREYVPSIILFCPYISYLTNGDITNLPIVSQGGPDVCRVFPSDYLEG